MVGVLSRLLLGKLFNALGVGTPIRECTYRSDTNGSTVTVEHRDLFTVVTVNGCDVYFSRVTGKVSGVVPSPDAETRRGEVEFIFPVDGSVVEVQSAQLSLAIHELEHELEAERGKPDIKSDAA